MCNNIELTKGRGNKHIETMWKYKWEQLFWMSICRC